MTQKMKATTLIIAAMVAFSTALNAAEPKAPKNVVVIFADDMGYGDLGCYRELFNGDADEMYHIASDIGERKNVIAERPEQAGRLRDLLQANLRAVYPHLPAPPEQYKAGVEARLK